MKKDSHVTSAAKLLLSVATFLGVLLARCGTSSAQSGYSLAAESPSGSIQILSSGATPSLLLEGKGRIRPSSPECFSDTCSGTFSASLSGRPFLNAALALNLTVNRAADPFTRCNQVVGTGGMNNNVYFVKLVGQLCESGVGYVLSGTVQIYSSAAATRNAAVGTLLVFGGTNIPPNPVPNSGPSLVSILGVSGTIPLLLP
jgi:hypothetical protein